ncbi:g788 [Coccomyxa elongata]
MLLWPSAEDTIIDAELKGQHDLVNWLVQNAKYDADDRSEEDGRGGSEPGAHIYTEGALELQRAGEHADLYGRPRDHQDPEEVL